MDLVDFFPRPKSAEVLTRTKGAGTYGEATRVQEELKKWLVRRVECIRGSLTLGTGRARWHPGLSESSLPCCKADGLTES